MRWLALEPGEARVLALMGALVSTLLCAYTVAKVLRDALFLEQFGALSLPYAYLGVAFATAGFVWIETQIARRFARVGASRFNQILAIVLSAVAAVALPIHPHWTTALFYVWTGSQAMMLVPHFWVLALDVWDSRRARRVFPLLTGFGLVGGLAGGAFVGWATPLVHRAGLMWSLPIMLLLVYGLTALLESRRARRGHVDFLSARGSPWKTIRQNRYILILVISLALSVIVGTLVDFQFKYLVQRSFFDTQSMTQFLGRFYVGLNALSLLLQFGAAGWLLQRLGLGVATGLQPTAILALATWASIAPGMWVVIALRWSQGVLSQTVGKSGNEIYYAAIRPNVRRQIKPAIDTLVERWSDAVVGVLLIVTMHALGVHIQTIGIVTAALTAVWIVLLVLQDRHYGRAFQSLLSSRWIEPEDSSDAVRTPAARRVLIEALHAEDERRIVLSLQLSARVRDPKIASEVRRCLAHASPAVRVAAMTAMETLRLADPDHRAESFLSDSSEEVRRTAVRYLMLRGPRPVEFTRGILDGGDRTLHRYAVDVLFECQCEARRALTLQWIDPRLASDDVEDVRIAARALGVIPGQPAIDRLHGLLTHDDLEVRRTAITSAIRRPSTEFLDDLLPALEMPELHHEVRLAVAAIGDPAIPWLEKMLDGKLGARAQSVAANTIAQIGSRRAIQVLLGLARSTDLRSRHLGLRGLARVRVRAGEPVLARGLAHRLFLRELRDCRLGLDASTALESHPAAEVRLLASSWRESAEWAIERAMQALASWYESRPLIGVLERLRSRDRTVQSPALEFLEHLLPRSVFRPVRRVFEDAALPASDDPEAPDPIARWIEVSWNSDDPWLRACAVRASRCVPSFDPRPFQTRTEEDPLVKTELAAAGLVPEAAC